MPKLELTAEEIDLIRESLDFWLDRHGPEVVSAEKFEKFLRLQSTMTPRSKLKTEIERTQRLGPPGLLEI